MREQRSEEGVLGAIFLTEIQQVGTARQERCRLFVSRALSDPL